MITVSAQNSAYGKKIYQDYRTWTVEVEKNSVSISAFCTVEEIDVVINLGMQYRELKKEKNKNPETLYSYEIYFVSKSIYDGDTTNTWLYGTKVFINNEYVLNNQFPDGFIILIKTTPTLIHTHRSKDYDVKFNVTWEKAIYEPRIRK